MIYYEFPEIMRGGAATTITRCAAEVPRICIRGGARRRRDDDHPVRG